MLLLSLVSFQIRHNFDDSGIIGLQLHKILTFLRGIYCGRKLIAISNAQQLVIKGDRAYR